VKLASGKSLTALEIQERYLTECESYLRGGNFPEWTGEVVRHWRDTLERLSRSPLLLARRLDPYTKLLIYDHQLRRAGLEWRDLHAGLQALAALRGRYPDPVVRAVLSEDAGSLEGEILELYRSAATEVARQPSGALDRLRFAVRLQVLDVNYHELGGLYDQLAQRGEVESVVLSPGDIERAAHEPPPGGRAEARGRFIENVRETGWMCDWCFATNRRTGKQLDFTDPFATEPKECKPRPPEPGSRARRPAARALAELRRMLEGEAGS
jgi:hypothetical protein